MNREKLTKAYDIDDFILSDEYLNACFDATIFIKNELQGLETPILEELAHLAEAVRRLRGKQGLDRRQFADSINVSLSTLIRIENTTSAPETCASILTQIDRVYMKDLLAQFPRLAKYGVRTQR